MTRDEFLNIDWNDSHVVYDIQVGNFRRIAYMTLSSRYPDCLCLVADNKKFPLRNSGCGISKNLCPADIIAYLNKNEWINRILAVVDNKVYDINPAIYINGIDAEILFDLVI